ncbi:nucleoid-associated protein [Pseudomonas syringae group sp. J309-1]|uniref:nucleoid-associated protein n=1 Tax=Pseudomonas syringae group sp. J309-1 TaxID=3079588 RepID=UPI002912DC6A|nr:nucleoid-associated protein [Pseudomonas syringae group sp. J309-1]MDU8359275.1 nucleoid-associated protein [Pseudomonas syringae group sp. J309-1]
MAFNLIHVVIHSFEKEKGAIGIDTSRNVIKPLFDPKIGTLTSLAEGINGLLGKKGNNVVWGQFSSDNREGLFPEGTQQFVEDITSKNFEILTHIALKELVQQASVESFATGGHTLFAYYMSDAIPFILVANIKQRDGLSLGPDYIPINSVDIDMSKVHQACRINLARYSESVLVADDDNEDVEVDKTYLCFISKGRDSEASAYFIKALGCTPGVASTRATANAIDHIEDFFRGHKDLAPFSNQAKDNVIVYMSKKHTDSEKATLSGLQSAACSAIPAELADLVDLLEGLSESLNSEGAMVPEEFTVNKSVLDRKTKIRGKSNRWSAQFDKSALGTSIDSVICYNESEEKLTFSDIPSDMKKLIQAEIKSRNGNR